VSGATEALGKRIAGAKDLGAVVRSMKALAASSIGQYEQAVAALNDYTRTVELGLSVCFAADERLEASPRGPNPKERGAPVWGAIVVGSDQGLVGRFNEGLFEFATGQLVSGQALRPLWCVGERMQGVADDWVRGRGEDPPASAPQPFAVPSSVEGITTLVNELLIALEKARERGLIGEIRVFHNRPMAGVGYDPIGERLLPLDAAWRARISAQAWPASTLPEVIGDLGQALAHFTREYLFVMLFRACAESLASENATRLAAMQRADKNIEEIQADLKRRYQRMRQGAIDEELCDVLSGYELLRPNGS
jgi:F-type H+-transporting ATPase subunit gamma